MMIALRVNEQYLPINDMLIKTPIVQKWITGSFEACSSSTILSIDLLLISERTFVAQKHNEIIAIKKIFFLLGLNNIEFAAKFKLYG